MLAVLLALGVKEVEVEAIRSLFMEAAQEGRHEPTGWECTLLEVLRGKQADVVGQKIIGLRDGAVCKLYPKPRTPRTIEKAARSAGVSERKVRQAQEVKRPVKKTGGIQWHLRKGNPATPQANPRAH
jgi:hypothetical protein